MSRTNTIGSHKTAIFTDDDGFTKVVYHTTPVVQFTDKEIILKDGGWMTTTTKARINQASNQFRLGYHVYQKDFNWYIDFKGETLNFYDGVSLTR